MLFLEPPSLSTSPLRSVSLSLSVCLSVYLSLSFFLCLFLCLFLSLDRSIYLSISLSLFLFLSFSPDRSLSFSHSLLVALYVSLYLPSPPPPPPPISPLLLLCPHTKKTGLPSVLKHDFMTLSKINPLKLTTNKSNYAPTFALRPTSADSFRKEKARYDLEEYRFCGLV